MVNGGPYERSKPCPADSIKKMNERKSNEQLARENAALREQVAGLQAQVEEQADALIELAAMIGEEG